MNGSWLTALVASLFGGVLGSVATLWMRPAPEKLTSEKAEVVAADDEVNGDVAAEDVSSVDRRLIALERKLSLLASSALRNTGAQPEDDAALPSNADVADPVFEAAVLDIMDRERERQDTERDQRRETVRKERTERTANDLETKLGLKGDQKTRVVGVIDEHYAEMTKLRESENPPANRREWRQKMEEITARTNETLSAIFSPTQMASYQALEPDEQIGQIGGGGRERSREERSRRQGDGSTRTEGQRGEGQGRGEATQR